MQIDDLGSEMDVLLSIKPKYVEAIISGQKRHEFRKVIFKRKDIDKVYIYSSSPVKKIVGAFRIGALIEDSPEALWAELKESSGISESEFFGYFGKREKGFAIEIENREIFDDPIEPAKIAPDFVPPQSFCYISFSFVFQGETWTLLK